MMANARFKLTKNVSLLLFTFGTRLKYTLKSDRSCLLSRIEDSLHVVISRVLFPWFDRHSFPQ